MAITRGQMQRQLRKGGGIMNVASGTIGGGQYAGIPMGSRTGFGILKKIGRGIRKIIPNEIANVAVKAAPFVAPFNPALAGAMAGIGSFDQSGNIGDALKRGALTFGGGQLARGIGGAGFQKPSMSLQGFTNLSSPITGESIFRGFGAPKVDVSGITGINEGALQKTVDKAALKNLSPEKRIAEEAATTFIDNQVKSNVAPSITQLIKQGNYTDAAVEAGKKGLKAVFMDGDKLDKTALLAAGSFGLTYLDAKKIADDAGVDIGTETEYDEATKAEKKEEYASYLTNFFGGKKDGGRIGFKFGDKVEDKEGILSMSDFELINKPDDAKEKIEELEDIMSMSEDEDMSMAKGISFNRAEKDYLFRKLGGSGGANRSYTMPMLYRILNNPGSYPNDARVLKEITIGLGLGKYKDGGRIGAKDGFSFMELIDDEAYNKRLQKKEDLINELMEKGYRFEDIMQLVSPRTERLMDDGTYKQYGDAPSISLGKIGFNMGGEVPVRKNKAGIEELDYRQTGGFVPVGVKEKADDVPAMLSKNEFVLTADAVRGIGGGDVEKGAEKLYGVMKQAEKAGKA